LEKEDLLLDPKWISSFYALVATAVCTLVFTYKGVDFFDAFIKTFFTVVSFYLFGLITAAAVNFYYINFVRSKEEKAEEQEGETGEAEEQEQEEMNEQGSEQAA